MLVENRHLTNRQHHASFQPNREMRSGVPEISSDEVDESSLLILAAKANHNITESKMTKSAMRIGIQKHSRMSADREGVQRTEDLI